MDLSAGIIVAVLTHAAGTIWWASKINTTMSFIREDLAKATKRYEEQEKEIKALWRKVDDLTNNMEVRHV